VTPRLIGCTPWQEMHRGGRYRRMLLVGDTCEAATLGNFLTPETTPEVAFVGSSLATENSYSHHSDQMLGVLIIDRFTHYLERHYGRDDNLQALFQRVREWHRPAHNPPREPRPTSFS
jgi:glycosylphosphatidylinositol transamidase (GPIT) subunit GPI8